MNDYILAFFDLNVSICEWFDLIDYSSYLNGESQSVILNFLRIIAEVSDEE